MKKLKLIILLALAGAIISFSFWPVVIGTDQSKPCGGSNFDCGFPEQQSARIVYLLNGQKFNDPNFSSRSDYCKISGTCFSEAAAVPLSILIGAVAGAVIGKMLPLIKRKVRPVTIRK